MAQSDTPPSIVVALSGGLGNQLFQYAMGRALSLRNGLPLVLDIAWFDQVRNQEDPLATVRSYALTPFKLKVATQRIGLPPPQIKGDIGSVIRYFWRRIPRRHMGRKVRFERSLAFEPAALSIQGPVWLDGYWQSHRYFDDFSGVLRSELGRPQAVSNATSDMLEKISGSDSICLHVRRGDYISNRQAASTHGTCSLDYYAKGMEVVSSPLSDPHCFVFSDEPDWAKNNIRFAGIPVTFIDINGPDTPHEDLWLMSACKHFVIANSSLSWWGAWLSEHEGKVVVAPRQWFANAKRSTTDLIPSEWIRI